MTKTGVRPGFYCNHYSLTLMMIYYMCDYARNGYDGNAN